MKLIKILILGGLLLAPGAVYAVEEIELINVEDEPRFNELANELRCMVCQNQSIADSNAELAQDFRNQVKEKINAGQSNEEIVDFMVARYGDYILYRPPFNMATALLWVGPFLLVAFGFFIVIRVRKRQGADADEPIDEKHQAQLMDMLKEEDES